MDICDSTIVLTTKCDIPGRLRVKTTITHQVESPPSEKNIDPWFVVILIYFNLLGMLHWTQEESVDPEKVSADPHQEEGPGAHQPQVHRHDLQVRSRKVPDPRREGRFHGTSQERQEGINPTISIVLCYTPPKRQCHR